MTPFDSQRMIFLAEELSPKPLAAKDIRPLSAALDEGSFLPQAEVICLAFGQIVLTLPIFEMMYHHVAQGEIQGQPWVVSLCMLCNAGNVFSPVMDGDVLHFSPRVIYDGMMMLVDQETSSCWNHISGECQYGQHVGKTLTLLSDARQMSAGQALALHPDAWLIRATLSPKRESVATEHEAFRQDPQSNSFYLSNANATMGELDPRLPRLEMGLGIWSGTQQRFYPFRQVAAADNLIFDSFDGQPLVLYIDPETSIPCAVYLDAQSGEWHGDTLYLGKKFKIEKGIVYDSNHHRLVARHPLQLFMRWFGFAFTFPGCEIGGILP